ncbi:CU044_2847 family protein [Kitasatospora sp. NPDC097643]|uniref:CU044_2847 family protein n=1 Tax=Kitasatospora sp. NPDC097643 TaxID=3157230 RepID=UPI0033295EDF
MSDFESVMVAVVPSPDAAGNLAGASLRERFADRVDELADTVNEVADKLRDRLVGGRQADTEGWGLDAVDMEFSVELEAASGVVLARAAVTGGFAVTLSFRRRHPAGG